MDDYNEKHTARWRQERVNVSWWLVVVGVSWAVPALPSDRVILCVLWSGKVGESYHSVVLVIRNHVTAFRCRNQSNQRPPSSPTCGILRKRPSRAHNVVGR